MYEYSYDEDERYFHVKFFGEVTVLELMKCFKEVEVNKFHKEDVRVLVEYMQGASLEVDLSNVALEMSDIIKEMEYIAASYKLVRNAILTPESNIGAHHLFKALAKKLSAYEVEFFNKLEDALFWLHSPVK